MKVDESRGGQSPLRQQSSFEDEIPRKSEDWYAEASTPKKAVQKKREAHFVQGLLTVKDTVEALVACMESVGRLGTSFPQWAGSTENSGFPLVLTALHRLLFEYCEDVTRRLALAAENDEPVAKALSSSRRLASGDKKRLLSSRTRAVCTKAPKKQIVAQALGVIDDLRDTEALSELATCLVDTAQRLPIDSAAVRALPGPVGGVMMLLEYIHRAINHANRALDRAIAIETQKANTASSMLLFSLQGSLCMTAATSCLISSKNKKFFSGTLHSSLLALCGTLPFIMQTTSAILSRRSISTELSEARSSLQTAVSAWCAVVPTLDDGIRLQREDRSYCTLLVSDLKHNVGLPERCCRSAPISPCVCFWWKLGMPRQMALLARGVSAWTASCSDAECFFMKRLPWLFYAVALFKFPTYFARPDAAGLQSASAVAQINVEALRRGWAPLDSSLLIRMARLQERLLGGLSLQVIVTIAGVKCFLCASGNAAHNYLYLRNGGELLHDEPPLHFRIILHVHGGAFVASFEAGHIRWFRELAVGADALVIVPYYSLAPEHTYPLPVNEISAVYAALRKNDIGLPRKKRTLNNRYQDRYQISGLTCCGESAGACILATILAKIAVTSIPPPDAVVLAYPPLNLLRCESPSRLLHAFDPFLPINILLECSASYGIKHADHTKSQSQTIIPFDESSVDAELLSYYAPDHVLQRFPPTLLLCGGTDPLLDDAVDFHTRLRRAKVEAHLLVHKSLPHGFLGMLGLPTPFRPPDALELARHAVRFLARAAPLVVTSTVDEEIIAPRSSSSPGSRTKQ